jgi:hypothetical protein
MPRNCHRLAAIRCLPVQYDAYDQLSDSLRAVLDGLCAVNAAGKKRVASTRSERLKDSGSGVDPDALVGIHPVVRTHPETGRKALFVNAAHTVAFDGLERRGKPRAFGLSVHASDFAPNFNAGCVGRLVMSLFGIIGAYSITH